jgi:hypothetical protein
MATKTNRHEDPEQSNTQLTEVCREEREQGDEMNLGIGKVVHAISGERRSFPREFADGTVLIQCPTSGRMLTATLIDRSFGWVRVKYVGERVAVGETVLLMSPMNDRQVRVGWSEHSGDQNEAGLQILQD